MSEGESAFLKSDLQKLAAEVSVKMNTCQRTGQLSRYMHLSQARDSLYAAIHATASDERQLTLDATEGQPDASKAQR